MPEVIADTSPLQYLYQIHQLDLLPLLYGQVKIPPAVAHELAQGRIQGIPLPTPDSLAWITLCPVPLSILVPQIPNLGSGEREALSLATTTPNFKAVQPFGSTSLAVSLLMLLPQPSLAVLRFRFPRTGRALGQSQVLGWFCRRCYALDDSYGLVTLLGRCGRLCFRLGSRSRSRVLSARNSRLL